MGSPHLRAVRRLLRTAGACTAAAVSALAFGATAAAPAHAASSHRVVVYYQTQYDNGTYVSPLGLTADNTGVTDVEVGAIHLDANSVVHLNDNPPSDPMFTQMWADLAAMQAKGVHVSAMVGGAAQGSFQRLDTDFATYYPLLKNLVTTYHLDGLDLDVEETMSLAGIERVIDQLRTDFGSSFIITLAPVVPDLEGGGGLSGFSYDQLYAARGSEISWFNTQFYCGWGDLSTTADYDAIMSHGTVPAAKVVAGVLTNPANCGSGYVDVATLSNTLKSLIAKYPAMGGVSGWEYFNSLPGDTSAPWQWAADVNSAMNGGGTGGNTGPITSGIAGKCVDDSGQHTANGTHIQIWTCNGTAAQQFTVNADGSLSVLGKCMDVTNGGKANGTKVELFTCNGGGAEVWKPQSDGALLNPQSGRCLSDPSGSTTDGTQLQIYTCNGANAQKWTLP